MAGSGDDKSFLYKYLVFCSQSMTNRFKLYYQIAPVMHYFEQSFPLEPRTELPDVYDGHLRKFPDCVYLALLLRDKEALDTYAQVWIADKPTYLSYEDRRMNLWVPLIAALCQGDDEAIRQRLQQTIAFTEHELAKPIRNRDHVERGDYWEDDLPFSTGVIPAYYEHTWATWLHLPWLQLMQRVYAQDEVGFNEALRVALGKHAHFYGELTDYRGEVNMLPEGFVSLGCMAACVLAQQRGLRRWVTSDYLIEWLIEGDFEGLPTDIPPPLIEPASST